MTITMKEVREEIDLLDKELVLLLARRQKCIEMAALVKNDEKLIIDEDRIEEVISKVKSFLIVLIIVPSPPITNINCEFLSISCHFLVCQLIHKRTLLSFLEPNNLAHHST